MVKVIMRTLFRFWFVGPILLLVVAMQVGMGLVVADNAAVIPTASATLRPTFTSTPSPTVTPTSTLPPTPTATPVLPTPTRATSTPRPTHTAPTSPTIESSPTIETSATNPSPPAASPTSPGLELLPISPSSPVATPTSAAPPVLVSRPTGVFNVPILMYHYLSTPPAGADAIRMDLSVPPDLFESHLAYLREAGYQTLSFQQLAQLTSHGEALPPKPIIITFDDGYRDSYQNAFPLLQKYGFTATFFIFTQPIDTANVNFLSWDMVREMHQAGMEFGSHSHTHPDLRHRSSDFLASEIVTSKQLIEQNIGAPIYAFAYPSGMYDDAAVEAVKSAGFLMAVTTEWGGRHTYDHRFVMPRVRIRGNDTAAMLAEKLMMVE